VEFIHSVFSSVPPVHPFSMEYCQDVKCLPNVFLFKLKTVTVEGGDLVLEEIRVFITCLYFNS